MLKLLCVRLVFSLEWNLLVGWGAQIDQTKVLPSKVISNQRIDFTNCWFAHSTFRIYLKCLNLKNFEQGLFHEVPVLDFLRGEFPSSSEMFPFSHDILVILCKRENLITSPPPNKSSGRGGGGKQTSFNKLNENMRSSHYLFLEGLNWWDDEKFLLRGACIFYRHDGMMRSSHLVGLSIATDMMRRWKFLVWEGSYFE